MWRSRGWRLPPSISWHLVDDAQTNWFYLHWDRQADSEPAYIHVQHLWKKKSFVDWLVKIVCVLSFGLRIWRRLFTWPATCSSRKDEPSKINTQSKPSSLLGTKFPWNVMGGFPSPAVSNSTPTSLLLPIARTPGGLLTSSDAGLKSSAQQANPILILYMSRAIVYNKTVPLLNKAFQFGLGASDLLTLIESLNSSANFDFTVDGMLTCRRANVSITVLSSQTLLCFDWRSRSGKTLHCRTWVFNMLLDWHGYRNQIEVRSSLYWYIY